jgi:hypothetical protein
MNHSEQVKKLAKQMMQNMTEQEKEFLLFINLCDILESDTDFFNESLDIEYSNFFDGINRFQKYWEN